METVKKLDLCFTMPFILMCLVLEAEARSFIQSIDDGDKKVILDRSWHQSVKGNQVQAVLTGVYDDQPAPSQQSIIHNGWEKSAESKGENDLTKKYKDSGGRAGINNVVGINPQKAVFKSSTKDDLRTFNSVHQKHGKNSISEKRKVRLRIRKHKNKPQKKAKITLHMKESKGDKLAEKVHPKERHLLGSNDSYIKQDHTLKAELNSPLKNRESADELIPQALDIPPRYLQIPHSKRALDDLLSSMKLQHPCMRKKGFRVNGKGIFSLQKSYLNLCKNDEDDDLDKKGSKTGQEHTKTHKHIRKNRRHKHRNKKQQPNHYDHFHPSSESDKKPPTVIITASEPKEKNEVENVSDPKKLLGTTRKEKTSVNIKKNYVLKSPVEIQSNSGVTSKEADEGTSGNLLQPRGGIMRPESIFPQQQIINNNIRMNEQANTTSAQQNYGANFISRCLPAAIDDPIYSNYQLNTESLRKLIDELGDKNCWQSGALKGIYHLEQLYQSAVDHANSVRDGALTEYDIDGLDRILCYLVAELKKCKNGEVSIDSSKMQVNLPFTQTDVNPSTQTSTRTTKRPELNTSGTTTKRPEINTKKTAAKTQASYPNAFDLNWEANLLFY